MARNSVHSQLRLNPPRESAPRQRCRWIIQFLGYNRLPAASTLAEQLVRKRTSRGLGLSQKESAGRIGVDPGTLANRERGERQPTGEFLGRARRFLQDGETPGKRCAG